MITLQINGREAKVPEGTTVLEAIRKLEIDLVTLCHDPRLKPYGGCRLCIVEIAGMPRPVTACTTPVENKMEVTTDSPKLHRLRRTVVELMLSDHPNDCLFCSKAGDCSLQALAFHYGLRENRFPGERRSPDRIDNNPFIKRDREKCILCGKCVRVCNEVQGVNAIDYAYRGLETRIATPYEKDLDCEFCGQCLSVCPTAALDGKMWLTTWNQEKVKQTDTICPHCGCGCNITLHHTDKQVLKVTAKADNLNEGWLCVKGRFGYHFINSPERLQTPLIRNRKSGELEPASWDEALNKVVAEFERIKSEHGPDALAGLPSARCTNEENYAFQKLFRAVIGTNNIDHCARY